MCEQDTPKRGLELLPDDALAAMVEVELEGYGKLSSAEGKAAFAELQRRTPE